MYCAHWSELTYDYFTDVLVIAFYAHDAPHSPRCKVRPRQMVDLWARDLPMSLYVKGADGRVERLDWSSRRTLASRVSHNTPLSTSSFLITRHFGVYLFPQFLITDHTSATAAAASSERLRTSRIRRPQRSHPRSHISFFHLCSDYHKYDPPQEAHAAYIASDSDGRQSSK